MPFEEVQQVQEAVKDAEAQLGSKGRVLLRYSGTESVARVMVEGQDDTLVEDMAIKLARAVEEGLRA